MVDIRVVHAAVTTSLTFQDIEITDFGDCAGALFFWGYAITPEGAPIADAHFGMGAVSFDGTDKTWAASYFVEHGGDPTNATHMGATNRCILFSNNTGSGVENNMSAIATQITNGIRLSWQGGGNPGTARRFTVVLFGGSNIHCEAGTVLDSDVSVDVAVGTTLTDMTVRPEVVFIAHMESNAFSTTVSAHGSLSMGFGADHSGTITQASHGWRCQDARNPADRHGANLSSTHIASTPPMSGTTLLTAWELTATGVTGTPRGTFEMTKRITGDTTSFGYFCYSSDGNNEYDVDLPSLAYTSGQKSYTAPGFQPQVALLYPSHQNNTGVIVNNFAVGLTASAIDEDTLTEGISASHHTEADPTDASSSFDSSFITLRDSLGAISVAAGFDDFISTGFRYTPSNTDGNTKPSPVLCIEEDGVAGTDFIELVNETVTTAEGVILVASFLVQVDETVTTAEGLIDVVAYIEQIDETVTTTEGIIDVVDYIEQIDETVTTAEGVIPVASFLVQVDETVTTAEEVISIEFVAVLEIVNETITTSEVVINPVVNYIEQIDETVTTAEGILSLASFLVQVDETVTTAEGVIPVASFLVQVDETVTTAEEVIDVSFVAILEIVNETITTSEGVIPVTSFLVQEDETVTTTEDLIDVVAYIELINETITAVEGLIDVVAYIELISETISVTDSNLRIVPTPGTSLTIHRNILPVVVT